MKKSELIKRRYEVNVEIEYNLRNGCYKCPLFNRSDVSNSNDCGGCPTHQKLSSMGKELIHLTHTYRKSKSLPLNGTALGEAYGEKSDKAQVRESLETKFDEHEFEIMRSRGNSYEEIGRHYGVSKDMIRRFAIQKGLHNPPKIKPRVFVDYDEIDKMITWETYLHMKKVGSKTEDIANLFGLSLPVFNKWIRMKKDQNGIGKEMIKA